MDELPLDIVFDSFSMIPVKSLLQWRCVSKLWYNIIDHPFLTNVHLTRALEERSMLLLSYPNRRQKTMSLRLVEESDRTLKAIETSIAKLNLNECTLEGSCNGLLCFAYSKKQCFVLSNPFRKEFLTLPLGTLHSPLHVSGMVSFGLGFNNSTNTYKIVGVVCRELDSNVSRVKVYSLGTSSWKEIVEVPLYPVHGKQVFAHGALHWLVSPFSTHENLEGLTVSFDVGKEKFSLTSHPNFDSKDSALFQLLGLNGNLAMIDLSCHTKIDIWVLKEFEMKEWVKEHRIDIHAPCGRSDNGRIEVIGFWKHSEILLKFDEGLFIYNPKTGLRYTQSLGLESDSTVIHSHRGSPISISKVMAVF